MRHAACRCCDGHACTIGLKPADTSEQGATAAGTHLSEAPEVTAVMMMSILEGRG